MNAVKTTTREATVKRAAVDTILVAAALLREEFSEWDLSVKAWQLDPEKFGMRGYSLSHPDHKRVSMEMAGAKRTNPIVLGWFIRTRPNHFVLTPLGRGHAQRLADPEGCEAAYAAVEKFITTSPYTRWLDVPDEPRTFGALEPFGDVAEAREAVKRARDWMKERGTNYLTRQGRYKRRQPVIDCQHVSALADFIGAMERRFPGLRQPVKARRA